MKFGQVGIGLMLYGFRTFTQGNENFLKEISMEMRKFRIVLVDENKTNVASFRAVIDKVLPDTEVFSASTGASGIELIKKTSPDVILIDCEQSRENALEMSHLMKQDKDLQIIPVLLITDLETDRELRLKAIEAGVDAFLIKPLDESILITQLKTMSKVRERNILILKRKSRLEALVKSRTRELEQEIIIRKKSEEKLKESENKFRVYIEKAPIGVYIADSIGKYIEVNEMACQLTGYTREELLHLSIPDYLAPDYVELGLAGFNELKTKGFLDAEYKVQKKDGQKKWVNLIGAQINDDCIITFCSDITKRKEKTLRIKYLSYHDLLTGVYNRTFYEEEIEKLDTKQHLPFSIIICDYNGLKLINDTLGYEVGDKILIETSKIISKFTRDIDIVARVGGDEFVIILPKTNNKEAGIISDNILKTFKGYKTSLLKHSLTLNISLGYATKTMQSESFSYIRKLAEDNMYRHKLVERNSYRSAFLESLKTSLFEKSNETQEHADRLVALSKKIAKSMDLGAESSDKLELLATLHDIGKISIDNSILTKPGKLTDEEWLEMKKHSSIGYRIAMASEDFKQIADGILGHHERWDGKGYPQEISGNNIPLLSRIISVIDAYYAMTNDRVYRTALTKECALSEIRLNSGTQFDPSIVNIFLDVIKDAV
jgi:diguanylate cyclase (GGDEF)-like protein/PAS domain S-box-containing protein